MSSHCDHSATDPAIAPLAYPAVAVACVLLAVAIAALPQLPLWAEDYGTTPVYTAFSLYSILAVLLLRWG
ncbi:hypothetical protein [Nocardia fluminea]|uniref:hypothetical protein n=1 Tax=Nocardia fluminea TaxID=134984 RepID=UPI003D0B0A2B